MPAPDNSGLEILQQTLANEIEDYRQLVALTQLEGMALQNGSLADLMAAVQSKEKLLSRLAQWEISRSQVMTGLLARCQLPASASLSDLIGQCDEAIGHKLSALRQELVSLANQLGILNHNNQLRLQAELVRVNATSNFLLSMLAPGGNYTANGFAGLANPLPIAGNVLNRHI